MLSIIIPVYNNAQTLTQLTKRLNETLTSIPFEVIFINDGSTDNSAEILRHLAQKHSFVSAIFLSRNFGQHPATFAGFERARGDQIIVMDADLDDEPEKIPLILEKLKGDVDIVYTIRKDLKPRFSSKLFHLCFSKLTATDVPVGIGVFRGFSRKVLDSMLRYKEFNIQYSSLMAYMGFKHDFLTIQGKIRQRAQSAYSFNKRMNMALTTLILYTAFPFRMSLYTGIFMVILSSGYGMLRLIQNVFFERNLPEVFFLIFLFNCLMFGFIFVTLGIIGLYMFVHLKESLKRPRYLIDEII